MLGLFRPAPAHVLVLSVRVLLLLAVSLGLVAAIRKRVVASPGRSRLVREAISRLFRVRLDRVRVCARRLHVRATRPPIHLLLRRWLPLQRLLFRDNRTHVRLQHILPHCSRLSSRNRATHRMESSQTNAATNTIDYFARQETHILQESNHIHQVFPLLVLLESSNLVSEFHFQHALF